ncbi:MAG TPA: dienelactone hydrolase family protein [Gemmatimonadales bacterium]|nr:dienelactone hydrolase family protein [Gemmatimonadales bacterium]
MAAVRTESVTLPVAGAAAMNAFVARPESRGRHAGIMVFQEAYGVNAHIRDVASRCAREGYTAIAPELFHRSGAGVEAPYGDFERVRPLINGLTTEALEADIRAAHAWLSADGETDAARIAAVGFCLGGRVAFLANLVVPARATVTFYGGRMEPLVARAGEAHGPALCFWGGQDSHVGLETPRKLADAMRAAGKRHLHVEISDAGHGFFCDAKPDYNPRAAADAWALTLAFLEECGAA